MRRFWLVLLLLPLISVSQKQSVGYDQLSVEDWTTHVHSDSLHSSIRPFNPGFEHPYFEALDSSYSTLKYKDEISFRLFGGTFIGAELSPEATPTAFNGIGVGVGVHVKDRLFIDAGYTPVYSMPSRVYSDLGDSLRIIPGAGFATKNGSSYLRHQITGRAIFNATEVFSLEVGNDKHFWGDGYRSLILSHNAAPYPYARITTRIWNVKYVNLWAQMRDVAQAQSLKDMRRKYTAMHALSWQATPKLNFSVYEMIVYQATDSLSNRRLDLNYANPIIFFRPVEFSRGSADNVLIGLSWKWKFHRNHNFYGQLMFDEFLLFELKRRSGWWANKYGAQLGMKNFNLFTEGLHVMNELNIVRPFTYTHGSVLQAFGHENQGLAHPIGTNFVEWINLWRFERENWYVSQKFIWAIWGRDVDPKENYGGNIFESYANPSYQYGNYLAQGLKSTFHWEEITYGRKISDKLNLWLNGSLAMRYEKNDHNKNVDLFVNFGLRTNLWQGYRDF